MGETSKTWQVGPVANSCILLLAVTCVQSGFISTIHRLFSNMWLLLRDTNYSLDILTLIDGGEKLQQLWKRQVPMFMASFGNLIRIIKLLSISKKEFQQFINVLKFKLDHWEEAVVTRTVKS